MVTNRIIVAPFQRVNLDIDTPASLGASPPDRLVCFACNKSHTPGQCRLKSAGVEHCGLCGLAHYGSGRTCPHLRSETQVTRMLEALKHSQEDPHLKNLAKSYIGGIKGSLAQQRRIKEGIIPPRHRKSNGNGTPSSAPRAGSGAGAGASSRSPPVVDLTGGNVNGNGTMGSGYRSAFFRRPDINN